jgi:hypothetical protein
VWGWNLVEELNGGEVGEIDEFWKNFTFRNHVRTSWEICLRAYGIYDDDRHGRGDMRKGT